MRRDTTSLMVTLVAFNGLSGAFIIDAFTSHARPGAYFGACVVGATFGFGVGVLLAIFDELYYR